MTDLRISADLTLPADAVTQTFGILAVRGAGKTNTAVVMAEEMYAAQLPFVFIDPVGVVWGLRSAADGEHPGLEIPIFGGQHGDVPLERTGGKLIADLVVDERLSCVLDLSDLNESDKVRFLTDFATRLYRQNKEPLHLFLDEADDYIPQTRILGDKAALLGAFENIVRRGRARGLGMTMISQRSAVINKNVLTQVETLIAMRITSPQDRKAIRDWIEYHSDRNDVLESLPSLETGSAWVWSPNWLGTMQLVKIRARQTFDSSATPKSTDKARPAARLADIDLSAVEHRMAETIERAKVDDPKELQKTIRELRLKVEQNNKELEGLHELQLLNETLRRTKDPERIEVPVLDQPTIDRLTAATDDLRSTAMRIIDAADEIKRELVAAKPLSNIPEIIPRPELTASAPSMPSGFDLRTTQPGQKSTLTQPRSAQASTAVKISGPQQRILDALAEMEAVGLQDMARSNVAVYSDASPRSSAFTNNLGALRSAGLIDYPSGGRVCLTNAGRQAAGPSTSGPRSLNDLHESWIRKLSGPQGRILGELIAIYPESAARDSLAAITGASLTSSAYSNNLGHLRSLNLIDYPQRGMVAATSLLFPEGLR